MRRLLAAILLAAFVSLSTPARAQVEGNAGVVAAVTLGTIGGLASSTAALVYAIQGRAFSSVWVVLSLFTSAICGAMTVAIAAEGADSGAGGGTAVGLFLYGGMTVWPGYWTIKTALAEVDPGEKFEDDVAPAPATDGVTSRSASFGPARFTLSWSF